VFNNFFDTSAIAKHYHAENGSANVDSLLAEVGATQVISRLTFVEMHSVFAKKVRTGTLDAADFQKLTRRFRADVAGKRLRVVRVTARHFQSAERLIRRIGPVQNLRTLDALQLAVAISLNEPVRPIQLVCCDLALCSIASAEGLAVVNPETT
jgi:uncharacterized protein